MKNILLMSVVAFSFSGCWLMPYQENFSCNSDLYNGSCGMVRDNYNYKENQTRDFKYEFEDTNVTVKKEKKAKYEYFILRKERGEK